MLLFRIIQELSFNHLLDIGCGKGDFIFKLSSAYPKAHFTGIDIDASTFYQAKDRFKKDRLKSRVNLLCGDCINIPLESRSTDVIVCRLLLHHVEKPNLALAEAHRVLRDGGLFLIQDGLRMPDPVFKKMNNELIQGGHAPELHPGFNVSELTQRLMANGFVVEKTITEGTTTLATPPYTKIVYSTDLFLMVAKAIKINIRSAWL